MMFFCVDLLQGDAQWQVTGDLPLTLEYVLTKAKSGGLSATKWTVGDVSDRRCWISDMQVVGDVDQQKRWPSKI